MPDFANEQAAEDFLIGAVVGGDTDALANTEISQADDLDRQQDDEAHDDEKRADGETEGKDEQEKPDAKAKTEEEPAPEEDEIEVEAEDGTKQRHKLADVLRKAQEFDRLETQKAEIVERVEREAVEHATTRLRQVEQAGQHMAYMIQGALQLLQAPQPPSTDMLDPSNQNYNPEKYHLAFAQFQRAQGQFQQAQGLGQHLMQQAKAAEEAARTERETAELQRLNRAWPEFSQPATMNKFVDDMGKAYGFSPQELDAVLTDHRQALVARDALAYRAMKAQSGDVKAKVEAKAPKLVRSKQEAKGSAQQARDKGGRFVGDALADLKKSNSDEAATRFFAGLAKAGRI